MKKGALSLVLVTLLVSSFLIGIVSAQSNGLGNFAGNVKNIMDQAIAAADPIISPLIGETPNSPYFFAKILFLIIIVSIVWISLSRIEIFYEYPWVLWIVSIAVGILGVKYLGGQWIITMLLPHEALAVTLAAGLPFVIYFVIVEIGFQNQPRVLRTMAWIFFAVIFILLWFSTYGSGYDYGELGYAAVWVYPITALLCFIMILFDGTIQRMLRKIRYAKVGAQANEKAEEVLLERMARIRKLRDEGHLTAASANARIKKLERQLLNLTK